MRMHAVLCVVAYLFSSGVSSLLGFVLQQLSLSRIINNAGIVDHSVKDCSVFVLSVPNYYAMMFIDLTIEFCQYS